MDVFSGQWYLYLCDDCKAQYVWVYDPYGSVFWVICDFCNDGKPPYAAPGVEPPEPDDGPQAQMPTDATVIHIPDDQQPEEPMPF